MAREAIMKFHKFTDGKGEFRWRLVADNGRIIATSGEGYKNEAFRDEIIAKIKDETLNAEVIDAPIKVPGKRGRKPKAQPAPVSNNQEG
jgi:uncharacterized protein